MKPTVALNMRLNPDTRAALEVASKEDRRSMASFVDKVLTDHLLKSGHLVRGARPAAAGYTGV